MNKEEREKRRFILKSNAAVDELHPHEERELQLLDDVDGLYDVVQMKNESIDRLEKENKAFNAQLAWHNGEGHAVSCPQGYNNCKCGLQEPPDA